MGVFHLAANPNLWTHKRWSIFANSGIWWGTVKRPGWASLAAGVAPAFLQHEQLRASSPGACQSGPITARCGLSGRADVIRSLLPFENTQREAYAMRLARGRAPRLIVVNPTFADGPPAIRGRSPPYSDDARFLSGAARREIPQRRPQT